MSHSNKAKPTATNLTIDTTGSTPNHNSNSSPEPSLPNEIADAWRKERRETQEQWRQGDVKAKDDRKARRQGYVKSKM